MYNVKGTKYKLICKDIDPTLLGVCDKENKKIYLNTQTIRNKTEYILTLAHELSHAYMREYNLDMIIDHSTEELFCMLLEDVVTQMIPEILKEKKYFEKLSKTTSKPSTKRKGDGSKGN